MTQPSRRQFLGMLTASTVLPLVGADAVVATGAAASPRSLRIRTITAGVGLTDPTDLARAETTIALLERAKQVFEARNYEVQTLRIATPPIMAESDARTRDTALRHLQALDELAAARDVRVSIGPVLLADRPDPHLPAWAAELIRTTRNVNFTVTVASPERGAAPHAASVAAQAMVAIARATPD